MEIESVLGALSDDGSCVLAPPSGMPRPPTGDELPADLERFYSACGGLRFTNTGMTIVAVDRFVSASEAIVGAPMSGDPSAHWYVVAEDAPGATAERLVIDLAALSRGRCYDAFWDRYGIAGSMAIVAASFTDLLQRLVQSRGQAFWNAPDFASLGDAYDGS